MNQISQINRYYPYSNHLDEHFFEFLVEGISSEIFVCDDKGIIIYMNPFSEYLVKKNRTDLIGQHISEILDQQLISFSVTQEVLKTKKEAQAIQKIEDDKELLAVGTPYFDHHKKLRYILTTTYDVGSLCNINNKLEEENRKLLLQMKSMSVYQHQFFEDSDHIFAGEAMESIVDTVVRTAPLDSTVLITGEAGVGKESVAKMIHRLGKTSNAPFVKVNCSLVSEDSFERELFGSAQDNSIGKITLANEGTLLLDGIEDLPLLIQTKFLDFLRDSSFSPMGSKEKINVNIRIIATTKENLRERIDAGLFLGKLYYRLNVLPIEIPPLRHRRDEIVYLAQYILNKCNLRYTSGKRFDSTIFPVLNHYDWPGNVREMEHVIERLYLTSSNEILTGNDLLGILEEANICKEKVFCTEIIPLKEAKKEIEIQLVKRACKEGGSTYQAAKLLGIDQSTVVKILKRHNIKV